MDFNNFKDFYPYYLDRHSNLMCRRYHFLGTCGVVALLILFFFTGNLILLALIPVVYFGVSWLGHLLYEKNKPITIKHPIYGLRANFKMFWEILSGRMGAF